MIKSGAANLANNRKIVNELNVFPVPDGDTGDNMSMTIGAAVKVDREGSLEKISEEVARETLLGARGNSGVILSRIIKGIAKGFSGLISADVAQVAGAMDMAVTEAYAAVAKPVEGTILSALKEAVTYARTNVNDESSIEEYFSDFETELKRAVDRTPEQMKLLKDAGVVDSGAAGLAYIVEGMVAALNGKEINSSRHETVSGEKDELDVSLFTEDSVLTYGYCTEFLLRIQTSKIDVEKFSLEEFKKYLNSVGDSVVAFQDGTIVKVHVHVKNPGKVLNYCQGFGEFLKLKIENMTLQHNGAIIEDNYQPKKIARRKKFAIVTVASGEGIEKTFRELGADAVIAGGQTMNPATNDFLNAYKEINAENILVYPNNKNILMAAEQSAEMYRDANIVVVPTRTIGEGYMAMSMLDTTSEDVKKILEAQKEVIKTVTTGVVSRASRTVKMDEVEVKEGDYIGYVQDKICVDESDGEKAVLQLAEELGCEEHDLVILLYGGETEAREAEKVAEELRGKAPMSEVILMNGGMPVHEYILILS